MKYFQETKSVIRILYRCANNNDLMYCDMFQSIAIIFIFTIIIIFVMQPLYTDCSESILSVRTYFCSTWALCVTADVKYGIRLNCLQDHKNWISTYAVCYLWLFTSGNKLPVQKLSTLVGWPCQHHDNPVGADCSIQVHLGLCQCWQGDVKSQFLMELQIHDGCKKVVQKIRAVSTA